MNNFFNKFRLGAEKESLPAVIKSIGDGVVFRGTNLWVLIFAIFVASLGLNVNSTAVIIGAMLISPLMGPIMGIGLAIGINDFSLLRKAIYNLSVAAVVALTTSTLFYLLSPLNDAHSELLARTSPNIYDVLIALFGGFAGIVATMSRQKGNVIPGVAIATALMPPLCTAGYGLATWQLHFFYGAFYLFIINTVFIGLSTFIIVRLLHFPHTSLANNRADKIASRFVWLIAFITLLPSLYFGYDMVQQNQFTKSAGLFINNEAHFPNDYLLNRKIDARNKTITLVFGGKEISAGEIVLLKKAAVKYGIDSAKVQVKQGFSYLAEDMNAGKQEEETVQLTQALAVQEEITKKLQARADSTQLGDSLGKQVFYEMQAQYPAIRSAIITPVQVLGDSTQAAQSFMVLLSMPGALTRSERAKLAGWLKIRLNKQNIKLIIQ